MDLVTILGIAALALVAVVINELRMTMIVERIDILWKHVDRLEGIMLHSPDGPTDPKERKGE